MFSKNYAGTNNKFANNIDKKFTLSVKINREQNRNIFAMLASPNPIIKPVLIAKSFANSTKSPLTIRGEQFLRIVKYKSSYVGVVFKNLQLAIRGISSFSLHATLSQYWRYAFSLSASKIVNLSFALNAQDQSIRTIK
jgi:hypothetical protein